MSAWLAHRIDGAASGACINLGAILRRSCRLASIACILLLLVADLAAGESRGEPRFVAGEAIVALRASDSARAAGGAGVSADRLSRLRRRHRLVSAKPLLEASPPDGATRRRARQAHPEILLVELPPGTDVPKAVRRLATDAEVLWAEPNYVYSSAVAADVGASGNSGSSLLADDPFLLSSGSWGQPYDDLWGLRSIGAPAAWSWSQGEGVTVAVIDSGLDTAHPDLAESVWRNGAEIPDNGVDDDQNGFVDDVEGWDFTSCERSNDVGTCVEAKEPGNDVSDRNGHGTHVAGIAAARSGNGIGIAGVAPLSRIMAVKALDRSGHGVSSELAAAILYAADNGAGVINASWTGPFSHALEQAVAYATSEKDVVMIAAAGNDAAPLERGVYPADFAAVLAVGATTQTDEGSPFSNFGGALDLVAPGGGETEVSVEYADRSILSTWASESDIGLRCFENEDEEEICEAAPWVVGEQYVRAAGSSMATAFVSGAAALLRSWGPSLARQQIRQLLIGSARDLGHPGWDPRFGYGKLALSEPDGVDVPVAEIADPDNDATIPERAFPLAIRGTVAAPSGILREWRLRLLDALGLPLRVIETGSNEIRDGLLATMSIAPDLDPGEAYVLELVTESASGAVATDRKTFFIPNPKFALLPIPDPSASRANGTIRMSGDGRLFALLLRDTPSASFDLWLFDVTSHRLEKVAPLASSPALSPDGRFLFFVQPDLPFGEALRLYDVVDEALVPLSLPHVRDFPIHLSASSGATRLAFIARSDLDSRIGNADGSFEVFTIDRAPDRYRQITNTKWTDGIPEITVDDLTVSEDGARMSFAARPDGSPSRFEAFLYESSTGEARQLTTGQGVYQPVLSGDGNTLVYESPGRGFRRYDVSTSEDIAVVEDHFAFGYRNRAAVSFDGRRIAFTSAEDLDRSVRNQSRVPQLFLFDVGTGSFTQVTDSRSVHGTFAVAMDRDGSVMATLPSAPLEDSGVTPTAVRILPRTLGRRDPLLAGVPTELVIGEGQTRVLELSASDPDAGKLAFWAEPIQPQGLPPADLANWRFTDRGDGTATLELTPRHFESGSYVLRVAVFDDGGGYSTADMALRIEDTQPEGDTNCDGQVDRNDVEAAIREVFRSDEPRPCPTIDANGDGAITVGDIPRVVTEIAVRGQ